MVFVVEKQTTKYLPTKQLPWMQQATSTRGVVYLDYTQPQIIFHKPAKFSISTKILHPEKYVTLYSNIMPRILLLQSAKA